MKIRIDDDFDLYKIAYSGQCFRVREIPANGGEGERSFVFVTGSHVVEITACGKIFRVGCSEKEWNEIWVPYFDLNTSYKEIRECIPTTDTYLSKCAAAGIGIRILRQDKFEMLISFIISQRKSIPAIKSAVEKLCFRWGKSLDGFEDIYSFPTPEALAGATEEELKECGLGYRVPYVMAAAKAVASGELDLEKLDKLDDEELLKSLKSLYGVGDKVANCVLLFGYHRIAAAPVDTWILKVMKEEYGGRNPFEDYPKTAGIMQQYMFYGAQHEKNLS